MPLGSALASDDFQEVAMVSGVLTKSLRHVENDTTAAIKVQVRHAGKDQRPHAVAGGGIQHVGECLAITCGNVAGVTHRFRVVLQL